MLRWIVKVVLLRFRPLPPMLSATLPPKVPGTPAVRRTIPFEGVVTMAVVGTPVSLLPEAVPVLEPEMGAVAL